MDLDIGPMVWNRLMQRYMDRKTRGSLDTKELHRLRNTMDQALVDKDMTIKTFFMCLDFIAPANAKLRIKVVFPEDHPIEHLRDVTVHHSVDIPYKSNSTVGKKTTQATAFLKRLFDTVCELAQITSDELMQLKDLAIDDPRHGFSQDPSLKASTKSNLVSFLNSPKVSWKIFRRLLFMLKPKRIYLAVILTMPITLQQTVHEVVFKPRFSR